MNLQSRQRGSIDIRGQRVGEMDLPTMQITGLREGVFLVYWDQGTLSYAAYHVGNPMQCPDLLYIGRVRVR